MDELKPCPFCGGEKIRAFKRGVFPLEPVEHFVACWECGAKSGYFKSEEEAIVKWNTRSFDVDAVMEEMGGCGLALTHGMSGCNERIRKILEKHL